MAFSHRFQKVYVYPPPPMERYFGASDEKFKNPGKKAKTHRVGAQRMSPRDIPNHESSMSFTNPKLGKCTQWCKQTESVFSCWVFPVPMSKGCHLPFMSLGSLPDCARSSGNNCRISQGIAVWPLCGKKFWGLCGRPFGGVGVFVLHLNKAAPSFMCRTIFYPMGYVEDPQTRNLQKGSFWGKRPQKGSSTFGIP